jgi:hypothetical protein
VASADWKEKNWERTESSADYLAAERMESSADYLAAERMESSADYLAGLGKTDELPAAGAKRKRNGLSKRRWCWIRG